MGLVVDEIIDIVEERLQVDLTGRRPGVLRNIDNFRQGYRYCRRGILPVSSLSEAGSEKMTGLSKGSL